MPKLTQDPFGFTYGPAKVERLTSDEKLGWVMIGVKTAKAQVQVYVTKTGKVRVFRSKPLSGTLMSRPEEMFPAPIDAIRNREGR